MTPVAGFLDQWLVGKQPERSLPNFRTFREREGARKLAAAAIKQAVLDHLVGLDTIKKIGGYDKTAQVIKNRLPTTKRARSADLGEILATEYVSQQTSFDVPLKRLRFKDDRNMAMRGDDVIGIRREGDKAQVLKAEAKSRDSLSTSVVQEASDALMRHSGRPNPSTLAFISTRLREIGRDEDAATIELLQTVDVRDRDIEHLLFTLSGNDPTTALAGHTKSPRPAIQRHTVGVMVKDHQEFIHEIFEDISDRDG